MPQAELPRTFSDSENPENPEKFGSGVRSEGFFSVGVRSAMYQIDWSENPELKLMQVTELYILAYLFVEK